MKKQKPLKDYVILIKGAGEKASAVAHRLYESGFTKIVMTEKAQPMAERRWVCFSEAIVEGQKEVCAVAGKKTPLSRQDVESVWSEKKIAIIEDPEAGALELFRPDVFIDAVMAKRNTGTQVHDAPLVIALGPGFTAGKDAHIVVETNPSSSRLGALILIGTAEKNTGIPTPVAKLSVERLIRASDDGTLRSIKTIGEDVEQDEVVAYVNNTPIHAGISGVIWGLVRDGLNVKKGMKIGDIDPRGKKNLCFEITPQARAIAEGVLEAIIKHRFMGRQ